MSSKASSTIGFERRFNHALNVDQDEFVQERTNSSTPRPPNMDNIVELNRGPFVGAQEPLGTVDSPDGGSVLDVRRPRDFVAGHVHGAFNVSLTSSSFATKAAFVLSADEPVAIYAESAEDAETAAQGLRSVGLFKLRGYLPHADATEKIEPIDIDELEKLLANGPVEILDVREKNERDEGYIDGTRHMPYRIVRAVPRGPARRPPDRHDLLVGLSRLDRGQRDRLGGDEVRPVLGGGIPEWAERGGNVVQFRRCGS